MPLISIVIPTRNRAHLLRGAVLSALKQVDFEDYEVLISDNSVGDEGAAQVAQELAHPRLRYVRTGEDLDIYRSWDFALKRAEGEYALLLADDDCLMPQSLNIMGQYLEHFDYPDYLGLASGWYSYPSRSTMPRNALRFETEWTEEGLRNPEAMLRLFFMFGRPSFSPTYVMVKRKVREEIFARGLTPSAPLFPDFAYNTYALGLAESAAVTKVPVVIHGYAEESLGDNMLYPREKVEWSPPQGETECFRLSPFKGYNFINGWLETILRAQEAMPDRLGHIDIAWNSFLQRYLNEIYIDAYWRDVQGDMENFSSFVNRLPAETRSAVLQRNARLLQRVIRMVQTGFWEQVGERMLEWVDGKHYGFSNITECSEQAFHLYLKKMHFDQLDAYVRDDHGKTAAPEPQFFAGGMR